jgi:hypothetical protein
MVTEIIVKQRPHPDDDKLTIKRVESIEYMCPKTGPDGKIITGIDENAYDIVALPAVQRAEKMAKVKAEREELERVLGVSLVPEAAYWDKFFVALGEEIKYDPLNAKHRLLIHFLTANRYVAPSLEDIENTDGYENTMFYLFKKEEETSKTVKKTKILNKATAKLEEIESSPTKMKIVAGYIFGYDPKSAELDADTAYLKLSEYLSEAPEKEKYERAELFVDVCSKDQEELMTKIILDKAINKHVVHVRGGVYKRNDFIYGNSYDEALEFLADPANSGELISLGKEVQGKVARKVKK